MIVALLPAGAWFALLAIWVLVGIPVSLVTGLVLHARFNETLPAPDQEVDR